MRSFMRSRLAWSLACLCAIILAPAPATAAPRPMPVIDEQHRTLTEGSSSIAWSRPSPWWETWNMSAGAAYAKNGPRNVLEAMSECAPPRARHEAASKVVYNFRSGYRGIALVRPNITMWGQLLSYPGGLAGYGEGSAKLTFTVRDLSEDDTVIDEVLYKEENPTVMKALNKGVKLINNQTIGEAAGTYRGIMLIPGHEYEATVKLWTECSTLGLYTVRIDFSRHALGKDVIGRVTVGGLQFQLSEVGDAHGNGSGDSGGSDGDSLRRRRPSSVSSI